MSENDPIIWRCLSYHSLSGGINMWQQQVMFDDMVATERLSEYFKTIDMRKVDKVTVKRLGTLSYVMAKGVELGFDKIRSGADRISQEKKNHKLEEYVNAR